MQITEIETVNLPRELRQYRDENRWVAFSPDGFVSDAVSYSEAIRLANGRGGCDTAVGFLTSEPVAAPDWKQPQPSIISRKKPKLSRISPNYPG
jgi:hypothetical protein